MTADRTRDAYARAEVVALYEKDEALHASEAHLFEAHIEPGTAILDLGVGTGRTTPRLSALASRYLGVDVSPAMVARCRARFPGLEFRELDATDMSALADGSFGAVVFSFNGMGSLPTDAARQQCLRECARVLVDGGVFIFSIHNARYLVFPPVWEGAGILGGAWRLLYAATSTARNAAHRLPSRAFREGAGYVIDPLLHGGLTIFVATPGKMAEELGRAGLRVLEVVPSHYPRRRPDFAVPWYYYACRKEARGKL